MLFTEWNTEDCIAYRCEEIREEVEEKYRGVIAGKDAELADKDAELANHKAEITRLQAELSAR